MSGLLAVQIAAPSRGMHFWIEERILSREAQRAADALGA